MCGICGVISDKIAKSADAERTLNRMLSPLARRGPDESGYVRLGPALIGHRRLKVIDLEGGRQPMTGANGKVVLTYNGEIYNFRQLRESLKKLGYRFYSTSDTEVLLNGYLHWGISVLNQLNGMFAFAVWDQRQGELFLARDRMGKKPLYWTQLPDDGFIFASELSSLHQSGLVESCMNRKAALRYLALGYLLGDESILKNIFRLPPASYLSWKLGSNPRIVEYWNLAKLWQEQPSSQLSEQETLSGFEDLLKDAVQSRLVADVPLGAFLSGGIDSSMICALIKPIQPQIKTITVGFAEGSYDESQYASQVAMHLGISHDLKKISHVSGYLLEDICQKLDEPFADTSIIPTFLLCQAARKQFTVALSGDGADELLAGYPTSQADILNRYSNTLPRAFVRLFRFMLNLIPENRRKVNFLFKSKQFLRAHGYDPRDAHAMWRMLLPDNLLGLTSDDVMGDVFAVFRHHYLTGSGLNECDRLLYVDYKTWLVDDILVKVDRASMNHGLEIRSPFLDYRLVEYCAGLPAKMKMRGLTGKWLLRQVAEKYIPKQIIQRRKSGFNAPVSEWLVTCWREHAERAFSRHSLEDLNLLPPEIGVLLWKEHLTRRRDHGYFLFALLILDMWRRQHPMSMG